MMISNSLSRSLWVSISLRSVTGLNHFPPWCHVPPSFSLFVALRWCLHLKERTPFPVFTNGSQQVLTFSCLVPEARRPPPEVGQSWSWVMELFPGLQSCPRSVGLLPEALPGP